MRKGVDILQKFRLNTRHEHPNVQVVTTNYLELLQAMNLDEAEIARRMKPFM